MVAESKMTHLHRINQLISEHPLPTKPLWVHFDVDVLRVEDCPATNYPTPGGPTVPELEHVFTKIRNSGRLCGVSVSLWQSSLPGAKKSAKTVLDLVQVLTGA